MTSADSPIQPVLQMRVVVEAEDYDAAVHFYRHVLADRASDPSPAGG